MTASGVRAALRTGALVFACAGLLTACSSTTDKKTEVPGAKKNYPNLASVPDKPPKTTTPRQRMKIQEGLFADRKNARHVDGPVAGEPGNATSVATVPTNPVKRTVITPPSAEEVRRRMIAQQIAKRREEFYRRYPHLRPKRPDLKVGKGGYVATVKFPPKSAALPPGSGKVIVQVAALHRYAGGRIRIIGRDDDARVAAAKANAVASGLIQLGVKPGQIGIVARNNKSSARKNQADIYIVGARRR